LHEYGPRLPARFDGFAFAVSLERQQLLPVQSWFLPPPPQGSRWYHSIVGAFALGFRQPCLSFFNVAALVGARKPLTEQRFNYRLGSLLRLAF
jgi:hypothetical protein